ncbi:hypothetical protein D9757_009444 [Collybiopsis confluens]|uniref:Endonuclease/exonuclease/phosphatase domain-containing protein n=1 Tax=Collybiopsis confluens TaxID=2823264 RepID=A0A8H5HDI6_9AGAR|nr:hypothetical protein D9757_009444 [Collybiopsis confluens]
MNTIQTEMRLPSAVEHVGLLSPALPDGAGKSNRNSGLEVRDQADVVDRHSACSDPLLDMLANDTQGLCESRGAPGSAVSQGFNEGLREQSSGEIAGPESSREPPGLGGPAQPLRQNLESQEKDLQHPRIGGVTHSERGSEKPQPQQNIVRDIQPPVHNSDANDGFINEILSQIHTRQEVTIQQQNAERWVETVINQDSQHGPQSRNLPNIHPPTAQHRPAIIRAGSRRSNPIKKRTSARYHMASLNMNGRGADGLDSNQNKWNWIEELMAENHLGMITLQETHLDQEMLIQIQEFKKQNLLIENTADPDNPTGKGGVAIVLRKKSANVNGVTFKTVIPGRALLMQHPWHGDKVFTFLAIYAPAGSSKEKVKFYEELNNRWDLDHLPQLDGWGETST